MILLVKIVLIPSQSASILLAFNFIDSLSTIAISFSNLTTFLSCYPIVWWVVSGFLVLFYVSVTLGLARIYRVLGAHLDSTSGRTQQAVVGFQLLPILLALLGGLIGLVLYYNTPKPRAILLYLVNTADE